MHCKIFHGFLKHEPKSFDILAARWGGVKPCTLLLMVSPQGGVVFPCMIVTQAEDFIHIRLRMADLGLHEGQEEEEGEEEEGEDT